VLYCREKGGKAWIAFKKYGLSSHFLVLQLFSLHIYSVYF